MNGRIILFLGAPGSGKGTQAKLLAEDLLMPGFKISNFEALSRRLKRNYVFIFIIILVAWITKIFLHAQPRITDWSSFYEALHVAHSIPSWFVAFIFCATFIVRFVVNRR